ncbi:MAG: YqgE/AlgH family protein [Alphaproteobacteria bacterium]
MATHQGQKHRIGAKAQWLTGQLLVAMPNMLDSRFARSVIYICTHNEDGAMGLIVNRLYGSLNFRNLLEQLDLKLAPEVEDVDIHFGGPVEVGRGFVLHSADYLREGSNSVVDHVALTATIDILKDMAVGQGPRLSLMALGYSAWSGGQLEHELQQNGWLVVPSDTDLLFDKALETKWDRAIAKLGITPASFSGEAGQA